MYFLPAPIFFCPNFINYGGRIPEIVNLFLLLYQFLFLAYFLVYEVSIPLRFQALLETFPDTTISVDTN